MSTVKIKSVFIVWLLCLSSFLILVSAPDDMPFSTVDNAGAFSGSGTGTVGDPYQITNVDQLQEMNQSLGAHYALANDIDASATSGWNGGKGFEPIARDTRSSDYFQGTEFTGSLDGQDYTVTGLYINRPSEDYVGLFGWVDTGGSVSNISLTGINVEGRRHVGGLVGDNVGCDITDCYATGSVSGDDYVGGLVGRNEYGAITDCYATGSVSGTGNFVGGLVGDSNGDITNCYATGSVSGVNYTGGLVGRNNGGDITDCYATGSVSGTGISIGGLVGYNSRTITNCHATGSVSGAGGYVGGLVGRNDDPIINCYATGSVSGDDDVGGLVGYNYIGGPITNCYATGSVSGVNYTGGLVGRNNGGDITNCYATGSLSGNWSVGGLVGRNEYGDITNCYATGSIYGDNDVGGLVGGHWHDAITDCHATGNVNGTGGAVGGLVGCNYESVITNCYATGSVSGAGGAVGGLVGYNNGAITNCHATGSVSGTGDDVGGLVGSNNYYSAITNCHATGSVSGTDDNVGGLVGYNRRTITNCYATGCVVGYSMVGGFVGRNYSGSMSGNFWDTQTSGQSTSDGGTGKTTAEMKTKDTFTNTGWDFENIWDIREGVTYPFLQWEMKIMDVNVPDAVEDQGYILEMKFINEMIPGTWGMSGGESWLAIDPASGAISGTPTNSHVGSWPVTVTFTETGGKTYDASFTINVLNAPPEITDPNPPRTISEDQEYSYDFNSSDDGQGNISWSLDTDAGWLDIDSATGIINGTPGYSDAGDFYVNVTVNDGNGGNDFHNFTLNVHINSPPEIISEPVLEATEDVQYSYQVVATDQDVGVIVEETLSFSLDGCPDNMTIDAGSGLIRWTATNEQAEMDHPVTVNVTDGMAFSTQSFIIHVTNLNDPPVIITEDPKTSAVAGELYTMTFEGLDPDPTNDALSWFVDTDAYWLSMDKDTGVLSGVAVAGAYDVDVMLSDGGIEPDHLKYLLYVPVPDIETFKVSIGPIKYDDGSVASGLVVTLAGPTRATLTAMTDDEGTAVFDNVLPGKYDGTVVAPSGNVSFNLVLSDKGEAVYTLPSLKKDDDSNGTGDGTGEDTGDETGDPTGDIGDEDDQDGDGVTDSEDMFPADPAASEDSDNDGYPDSWNDGMDQDDSTTDLVLDAFPDDPAAAIDEDSDGKPDRWNDGMDQDDSTSGLVLDNQVEDPSSDDDEPDDDGGSDTGNDGSGTGWGMIGAIITIIVIVLVLVLFFFMSKKKERSTRDLDDDDQIAAVVGPARLEHRQAAAPQTSHGPIPPHHGSHPMTGPDAHPNGPHPGMNSAPGMNSPPNKQPSGKVPAQNRPGLNPPVTMPPIKAPARRLALKPKPDAHPNGPHPGMNSAPGMNSPPNKQPSGKVPAQNRPGLNPPVTMPPIKAPARRLALKPKPGVNRDSGDDDWESDL